MKADGTVVDGGAAPAPNDGASGSGDASTPAASVEPTYELSFPEGFTPATGIKIDDKDPRIAPARQLAKELGLDQRAFSRLLQFDAEIAAAAVQRADTTHAAEVKKLGTSYDARRAALETAVKARLGGDEQAFNEFTSGISVHSARGFELLEQVFGLAAGAARGIDPQRADMAARWYGGNGGGARGVNPQQTMAARWYGAGKG